jgi:hypothetical protein
MDPRTYRGAPMGKKFNPKLMKIVTEDLISAVRLTSSKYFYHVLNRDLEVLIKTTSRMLSQPIPQLGNFQMQRRHTNIFSVVCYSPATPIFNAMNLSKPSISMRKLFPFRNY